MMTKKTIAISGASGLIGSALAKKLKELGHTVWPMQRSTKTLPDGHIAYDYKSGFIENDKLEKCHAVIHLAGKNIMSGLWTKKLKNELYDSRVKTTELIANNLRADGGQVFLCASGISIYGDTGSTAVDENFKVKKPYAFLTELCLAWEDAANFARKNGHRVVNLRFAPVMTEKGGMLKPLLGLAKMGLLASLGDGQQYMSLISLEDAVLAIVFALNDEKINGPINICAPEAIKNKDFSLMLAHHFNKPQFLAVPKFALKLLGEQKQLMLDSVNAYPKVLLDHGFAFKHLNWCEILKDLSLR